MGIQELAEKMRVKCIRNECGSYKIVGKRGDIYPEDRKFSVLVLFKSGRMLKKFHAETAEFLKRTQRGDTEAVYFSLSDNFTKEQFGIIQKYVRIRQKQNLSDEERERRRQRGRLLAQSM